MKACVRSLQSVFIITAVGTAAPAYAWPDIKFPEVRISLPNIPLPSIPLPKLPDISVPDIIDKSIKEFGNGIRDILKEGEKIAKKSFEEIGKGGEDLRKLIEEGKCGGDICVALEATAEYAENSVKGAVEVAKQTEKRLSEGKPFDALWHLSIAPYDIQQENAAKAAMKSSIVRAVGQVAASAYGGPGGAAAYAAWLTYHATDGNLELSLKAGAIAGATAYAMDAISKDVELIDVAKGIQADEIVQRAVMSGAVSGVAVALSGGTKEEVEQAFTKGAVTSVIRDGYKELTKAHLQDNMKASQGVAYCLGANPNATDQTTGKRLGCLPDPDEYITKDGQPVTFNAKGEIDLSSLGKPDADGNYPVDFTKLDYPRPHVGEWSKVAEGPFWGKGETSGFMTGVSRVPGMNGMSVAHDIFDAKYNPEMNIVVDTAFRVGSIAPFVIMTYEGAGFGVQEMIRHVNARASQQVTQDGATVPGDTIPIVTSGDQAVSPENPAITAALANSTPVEIRHLVCKRGDDPVKNILLETSIPKHDPADYKRICRIDQNLGGDHWAHLWHAHHQKSFCVIKFNEMAVRYLNRGYNCYTSLGIRFDPVNKEAAVTNIVPTP
jgi:hypothetical protein